MRLTLAVILASLFLTGCAQPSNEAPHREEGASWTVYQASGDGALVLRSLPYPLDRNTQYPVDPASLTFNTTGNITAILVELMWTGAVQDLNVLLTANVEHCHIGGGTFGALGDRVWCVTDDVVVQYPGFGSFRNTGVDLERPNPARLLVNGTDLQQVLDACHDPCAWRARPEALVAAVEVPWTIYATVFYGPVPDGYTAIPT